jgi:hypothetical protein
MKKTTRSKLSLSSETIRRLDDLELAGAAGGLRRINGSATVDKELKCWPTDPTAGCVSDGCGGG